MPPIHKVKKHFRLKENDEIKQEVTSTEHDFMEYMVSHNVPRLMTELMFQMLGEKAADPRQVIVKYLQKEIAADSRTRLKYQKTKTMLEAENEEQKLEIKKLKAELEELKKKNAEKEKPETPETPPWVPVENFVFKPDELFSGSVTFAKGCNQLFCGKK